MICLFITIASKSKTNAQSVLFFPRLRHVEVLSNKIPQNISFFFTKVFSGHASRKDSLLHTITSD